MSQRLTLEDRVRIKTELDTADSFRKIAKDLGKSPTTISQEIQKHRSRIEYNFYNTRYNSCKHRIYCRPESCAANPNVG